MTPSRSLVRFGRAVFQVLTGLATVPLFPRRLRPVAFRLLGVTIGRSVVLGPGLRVLGPGLTIGHRVFFNVGVIIDNKAPVVIEDDVALGPGVLITTAGHDMSDPRRRQGRGTPEPSRIERGAWIGARAVILPGVTVGAGAVVAAGAVVTRDCKPHGLYAGVPARHVRDLPIDEG